MLRHVLIGVVIAVLLMLVYQIWNRYTNERFLVKVNPKTTTPQQAPKVFKMLDQVSGVSSIQGKREYMEDRYQAISNLSQFPNTSFYGVFDGHGGERAAQFTTQMLPRCIFKRNFQHDPIAALKQAYREVDDDWLSVARANNMDDGTTAITALIHNNVIYVANAGDSRCIMFSNGRVIPMSSDHKPNRPDEKKRIEDLGGFIQKPDVWRVNGMLALSRAIGDKHLKKWVTCEPEVFSHIRTPGDQYLILASDGLWDVVSNEEAAQIVNMNLHHSARVAADALVQTAYNKGSTDNITALVVNLRSK